MTSTIRGDDNFDSKGLGDGYYSGELTVTAGGGASLSHGLGSIPRLIKPYWVCKTAEHNYSVGDVVDASNIISTWTSGTAYSVGVMVGSTSSTLFYRYGTTQPIGLLNKTTGASAFGTVGNWRLVIYAWK